MLFNSLEFALLFLPFTLLVFVICEKLSLRNNYILTFLMLASVFFYSYWNINFLPIILVSTLANYLFGLLIANNSFSQKIKKIIFVLAVLLNIVAIGYYKYTNFLFDVWNLFSNYKISAVSIVLPLGISFFTFTQIAYLADIATGYPAEKNIIKYLLFVTYFPHLIAGPILHHKEMMPQFDSRPQISTKEIAIGLTVFAIGLFKKVIIADGLSYIANPVFQDLAKNGISTHDAWGISLAYTLQIYFDFSGYSDMAIGISYLFGIALPFNFDSPYKSRNIIEFWRRWHITLSRFLRDYVYIPLGGNKRGNFKRYRNLMLTMVVGGLWHGAGFTYLIWGFLHGCYLMINHVWRKLTGKFAFLTKFTHKQIYNLLALILTQFCVVIAWVYFRADSLVIAQKTMKTLFHLEDSSTIHKNLITNFHLIIIFMLYLFCFYFPNTKEIFDKWDIGLQTYSNKIYKSIFPLKWNANIIWSIKTFVMLSLSLFILLIFDVGSQFLYFQF